MIPITSEAAFEAGLLELKAFGRQHDVRGRFIALYLGLRLMGDRMAPLGSVEHTTLTELQTFLDHMWTKSHRAPPLNVLTAPFGRGGPNGGYSTPTGGFAPGNLTATNTWRNNLNIQKGVGCVAPPEHIAELLASEDPRAACVYFVHDGRGHICSISHPVARYRGEKQSIWLARSAAGLQVVDLNEPNAFEPYLRPGGARIPVFALIAALYCFAPPAVYPARNEVTVLEFESDFGFPPGFVEITFDCDVTSPANARILEAAGSSSTVARDADPLSTSTVVELPLPALPEQAILNSGIQAEIAVGLLLEGAGWTVFYTAGQQGLGYDLRAEAGPLTLHIEVKSSVGYVRPVLTASEWNAANELGKSFVLAVVDFVGSDRQMIHFVHHPAAAMRAVEKTTVTYALPRDLWEGIAVLAVPTSS